jgi:hypothetical protein
LFNEDNERIGFTVIVLNHTTQHGEWPEGASDSPPNGPASDWGELEIPEFKDALVPIITMVFIAAVWRRKKRN